MINNTINTSEITINKLGSVINSPMLGTTVYLDVLGLGGSAYPEAPTTITGENGLFPIGKSVQYPIYAIGGINSITNRPLEGYRSAPSNSTTISFLSTMLSEGEFVDGLNIQVEYDNIIRSFNYITGANIESNLQILLNSHFTENSAAGSDDIFLMTTVLNSYYEAYITVVAAILTYASESDSSLGYSINLGIRSNITIGYGLFTNEQTGIDVIDDFNAMFMSGGIFADTMTGILSNNCSYLQNTVKVLAFAESFIQYFINSLISQTPVSNIISNYISSADTLSRANFNNYKRYYENNFSTVIEYDCPGDSNNILLEDGNRILQENGSLLII